MWEWVEVWKDGKEVVSNPVHSMVEAMFRAEQSQMPWAEDVVDHIIIRRVKE
jgi:hypothetical protein